MTTTNTANPTPAIDNVTALGLLVTAFNNPKIADNPLPEAIQLQAVGAFKEVCALKGIAPTQQALAVYLVAAWAGVSEIDKVLWQGRLIEVCDGD